MRFLLSTRFLIPLAAVVLGFAGCSKAPAESEAAATAAAPTPASLPTSEAKPAAPAAADEVAQAMPGILKQIAALDLPGAYVALTALEKKYPANAEVKKLLGDMRPVLAQTTPRAPETKPSAVAGARQSKRLAALPAFEQTQFTLFVKQAQAKRDLPALFKDVKAFCVAQPDFPGAWLLQAQLALALARPIEGGYAAEQLIALGATRSTDKNVIATMAELEKAGWLAAPR